jgi:hypothetical protein
LSRIQFHRIFRLTLLALAFVTLSAASTSTALELALGASPEGIGVRLTEVSAATANDPRARLYITDHLKPGTAEQRTIEVQNLGNATQSVDCYASAAEIRQGAFVGSAGSTPSELTSWITLSKSKLSVGAKESEDVVVTISVPQRAVAGERYGVIWAEIRSENSTSGIIAVNRVGIRVYLSVGLGGDAQSSFEIRSLTGSRSSSGVAVVTAEVKNTGERALDISGTLVLSNGPGGLSAGPFKANLGTTLAVHESRSVKIPLSTSILKGPWDVTVALKSGLVERQAIATITFPNSGSNKPVPITNFPNWLQLSIGIATFTTLIASLGMITFKIRSRRNRKTKKH